jgi:shikimate kinase
MGKQSASLPGDESSLKKKAPMGRVIILVGFMGAGKTTVGRELAFMLGWSFQDLDDRIQAREGRSIEEIFRTSGEEEFRRCENLALRELLSESTARSCVVALGGGAFAQEQNAALVHESNFPSVFLDAPVDELFRRCQQQNINRPLNHSESQFRDLYESRQPQYMTATVRIETNDKSVSDVAREVARSLGISPSKLTKGIK